MESITINPSIETNELSRHFGAGGCQGFSYSLSTKVESYSKRLDELLIPRLHYQIETINNIGKKSVSINGGTTFRSRKLTHALKDSDEIVCFVATVGSIIEDEIDGLMAQRRLSEAYVLDTMGSVAVENMVEQFHQCEEPLFLSENRSVTLRFSPGYCDWPLTDQKKLFGLFDSEVTGVELLDSCLMQPRKSISGVFGLYHSSNSHSSLPYNPCRHCKKTDCIARRA
ncbi:MAG: hypothetical protein LWX01_08795 [Deltaproteobacteria bacterium]|nr:hypothetical protein [Deltaproteobacteria bacterium]MDL1961775.1 hypothetical protein [Deltaproteobacteria bacterium]